MLCSQSSSEMEFELLQEALSSRDTRLSVVEDVERTGELRLFVLTIVDCSSLSVSVFTASVSLPLLSTCEGEEEEEQRVEEEMTSGRHFEDCLEIMGDRVPELTPVFLTLLSGSDNWRASFLS